MPIIAETCTFGDFNQVDEPKALIIPTPYEYTTTYGKGTKHGPQAILNASTKLEPFDDELWLDISKVGINTSNFVNCDFSNSKSSKPFNELTQMVRTAHIGGSVPIILGGEQSITFGALKAINDLYPEVSILHFDAHTDLKSEVRSNKYNHLCTMRRIVETMPEVKLVQLGVRNISKDEKDYLERETPNVEIFFAKEKDKWNLTDILTSLTKNVYISFDFSVFDISFMPSTGKPEPGGLQWFQILDIIKNVCAFKEVVGIDFVELAPISGLHAPDYLAAKLIYKTIGYTFARQLGVIDEKENLKKQEIVNGAKLNKIGS